MGITVVRKETILTASIIMLLGYTVSLSFVSQSFPQSQTSTTLQSTGNIQIQTTAGIGIFQNSQGTTPLTSILWGTLEPGQTQTIGCYITNEGNTPTTLSLQASNWNPTLAETYLTLDWNYNNQAIDPDQTIQVTITLDVDSNIEGITDFSFDITIIGST